MSNLAISVENLGKRYRLGSAAKRHDSLRSAVAHALTAPVRNLRHVRSLSTFGDGEQDIVWALRNLSFEVKHGEALGIIGRNGAGKSTLLKILSRITKPSTGNAKVYGRVGSLLEVGTGFHPELTGRENVYLNGSILGMDRTYIDRRFAEIVEFAGVERFIDTPVKRYSSGMYLRLAFAVAAHLEPEVLVVDEVLAVGDAEFQKKCLGKMGEVAGEGRTVLFVSHNMGAVTKLCDHAILLTEGSLVLRGSAEEVVSAYLTGGKSGEGVRDWPHDDAPGDLTARLRAVRLRQNEREDTSDIDMQQPFSVHVEYETTQAFEELNIALILHDSHGNVVIHTTLNLDGDNHVKTGHGYHTAICVFPPNALNAGAYSISVIADEPFKRTIWQVDQILHFEVQMTCPRMARYPLGSYSGMLGPRLVSWRRASEAPGSTRLMR